MTVKQLKNRIRKTEEALEREHVKNIEKFSRVKWCSGMREVHTDSRFRREFKLERRLIEYKERLKENIVKGKVKYGNVRDKTRGVEIRACANRVS